MHAPRQIWDRVNVWSVLATIAGSLFSASCAVVAVTLWYSSTNEKIDRLSEKVQMLDDRGKARAVQTDSNFQAVNDQLNGIPYRTGKIEQQIVETNLRIDRQSAAQGEDIKQIASDIKQIVAGQAKSDTKIEVLGSQVDDLKRSIANKIVWRDGPIFKIPLLREVSLKPCYLPARSGYAAVRSYYRKTAQLP